MPVQPQRRDLCRPRHNHPPQVVLPQSPRTEDQSLRLLCYEERNSTDDMSLLQKTCHIQQFGVTPCGAHTNQSEFYPQHSERQIGNRRSSACMWDLQCTSTVFKSLIYKTNKRGPGSLCEVEVNECSSSPCLNNGRCGDEPGGFRCICMPGFDGEHCEINVDECQSEPCHNSGTCVDLVEGYSCNCSPGFTGTACEIEINECSSNPCENNGTCVDDTPGYTCICSAGFEDIHTDIQSVHCLQLTCHADNVDFVLLALYRLHGAPVGQYLTDLEQLKRSYDGHHIVYTGDINLNIRTESNVVDSYLGLMASHGLSCLVK
ncbi:hypothetical protein J6590_041124 [Homalodisca vitripennis]|nr:hypothetical protein J6590_041124 [Homalodisca vitripennis]